MDTWTTDEYGVFSSVDGTRLHWMDKDGITTPVWAMTDDDWREALGMEGQPDE